MELLLINYQNMYNSMLHWKPCAEKEKFAILIKELELKIKTTITYPNGMTALEYAIKLATDRNNNV